MNSSAGKHLMTIVWRTIITIAEYTAFGQAFINGQDSIPSICFTDG